MAPRVARYRASSLFQNQRRKVVSHGTIPRKPEVSGAPRPRCADWPERVDLNRQSRFVTSPFGTFRTYRMRRAMSEFEGKAENICSHRVLLSLTHKSHCGHRAKGVPSQLPPEREGHEQFIVVFT